MASISGKQNAQSGETIEVSVTFDGAPTASTGFVVGDVTITGAQGLVASNISPTVDGTETDFTFDVALPTVKDLTLITITIDETDVDPVGALTTDQVLVVRVTSRRAGRAEANPAAKNYGTNLLGIVAEQQDYFSPIRLASATPDPKLVKSLYPNVIELRPPYTLTPTRQFYEVERLKGNASPDPSIPGMLMGQGELNFYLDPNLSDFWLKHLLQTQTESTLQFGGPTIPVDDTALAAYDPAEAANNFDDYELHTNDISFSTTAQSVGTQPKDALAGAAPSGKADPKDFTNLNAAKLVILPKSAGGATEYRLTGRDQNGATLSEVIKLGANTYPVESRFAYRDEVQFVGIKGDKSIDKVVATLSDIYEHTLVFSSDVSEGLSLEIQEGNRDTPIVYNGMLVQRGVFMLEEVARMQLMVIANEVIPREAMHGGDEATDVGEFERLDFDGIPAPGMSWEVKGDNVPVDMRGAYRIAQIAMAIDNRLEPPATSFADDFFYPKPVRKRNRELQMQVAIDHSVEADFDQFVGGLTFESVFTAVSRQYGELYKGIQLTTEQTQLINNPTRVVNNLGEVLQQIVFRGHIGNDPDGNDEATLKVVNGNATF